MVLHPGTRLGQYEVISLIGAGGMGVVYRARDSKLAREVAIKVIQETLGRSEDGLARFEREARLLASLNHPGIAILFGLEEDAGIHFLVMEFVDGNTLAERIAQGSIPVDEALQLFRQVAEALDAAHAKGIIHRDLKPANIKLTPEGKAKVLDFGLAKVFAAELGGSAQTESPTITRGWHHSGVLLGTAGYMSPEQARGNALDQRTDIWSFGCCLYEVLTGFPAFLGDTVSDTIAAILKTAPDWNKLPATTPARVRQLLGRCLEKDPAARIHDMGDVRAEIDIALSEPLDSSLAGHNEDVTSLESTGPRPRRAWDLKADLRLGDDRSQAERPSDRKGRSCTLSLAIAFTALFAIGTGIYFLTEPNSPLVSELAEGERLASEERYEEALDIVETLLARHPADSDALRLRDEIQARLQAIELAGLRSEAEATMRSITELKPRAAGIEALDAWQEAESKEALAREALADQDYAAAVPRLRAALESYQRALASRPTPTPDAPDARLAPTPSTTSVSGTSSGAPPSETDRAEILAVLGQYEQALEKRNLALFREVKPNLAPAEERRLMDAFRSTGAQEVVLTVNEIKTGGDEATVQVTRSDRIVVRNQSITTTHGQTFRLRKSGSRWFIVEIGQ